MSRAAKYAVYLLIVLALVLLIITAVSISDAQQTKQAWRVWDHRCFTASVGPNTTVAAPLVNGEPDLKHGVLDKAVITIKSDDKLCSSIEMR